MMFLYNINTSFQFFLIWSIGAALVSIFLMWKLSLISDPLPTSKYLSEACLFKSSKNTRNKYEMMIRMPQTWQDGKWIGEKTGRSSFRAPQKRGAGKFQAQNSVKGTLYQNHVQCSDSCLLIPLLRQNRSQEKKEKNLQFLQNMTDQ